MFTHIPTRRHILAGLTAAALPPVTAGAAHADAGPSLKALAAEKGILFGSALSAGTMEAAYLDILKTECGVIVPENEFKVYVIAAQADRYNFAPGDAIAGFARDNGMKLRGHTLLWNKVEFMPKWLLNIDFGRKPALGAERYLRDYIKRVCTHYGDQVFSWDVVNETIDPKTGEIRDTPFTKALGFDCIRIAFEAAREYAPRAQLVYNDYMSWEAGNETHRKGVQKLLEMLRNKNVPIDGFGIQSHIGNDGHIKEAQHSEWRAFVDAAVDMKYRLLITEFDVNDKDLPTDIAARDAGVAAAAKDYLDLMFSYKELDQFLCWGMTDNHSWLQGWTPRADKTPQRPTPYGADYRPKPLREAIAAALRAAPKR
ncbi:endo-1,4-beta-xylanase [Asticcacaulis sp. AND118]|uniref:endo-1,4-beta-xylanase n=1 Tax=Asticcacaulis sp. AND118 TaxID=2840468 RepID=UPI001CFFE81E|nr:endo-1,4-beta-xylanase [Asticcacaulis sp. AND118]UDF04021.1 endo-1,4-beta-xylanase [Asticcacaulis sp. AND118]